jgi:hypothetical protein
MKHQYIIKEIAVLAVLCTATPIVEAQSVNQWRGDEAGAEWSDQYKWKLKHTPTTEEAVHFREATSLIKVNRTVHLGNGMYLYGQELTLEGNGNINLQSGIPHQRTVSIPASATGYANMTLNDNLSLNGRVALSAKSFGTSASKGSITLKNRSTVTGELCIGNEGTGTGHVFVRGNATYRITALNLSTEAANGGSAEIHVLGGTVRIETQDNPFKAFLADPSRKIVIGDAGTLRIESRLSVDEKKDFIKQMIEQERLVAAPGCRLVTPVLQNKLLIAKAEDERNESNLRTKEDLLASIDKIEVTAPAAIASTSNGTAPKGLESMLKTMAVENPANAVAKNEPAPPAAKPAAKQSPTKTAGYIVFFGTILLALRRSKEEA